MKKYNTKQRTFLYEYFKANCDRQISVYEIYNEMEKCGKISLSAIYRNIYSLEKEGLIRKFADKESRCFFFQYIDRDKCADHLHLQCLKCGKISHMSHEATRAILESAKLDKCFEVDGTNTTIYGTCAECR